jgi:hypothetical protein
MANSAAMGKAAFQRLRSEICSLALDRMQTGTDGPPIAEEE